jgi:hypothetical protein
MVNTSLRIRKFEIFTLFYTIKILDEYFSAIYSYIPHAFSYELLAYALMIMNSLLLQLIF